MKIKIDKGSLFLAPMEGVTGPLYRELIGQLFPHWDYMACDFLRAPHQGQYKDKFIIKHYGEQFWHNTNKRGKTYYQILTSAQANFESLAQSLHRLNFPWVDLNLGCPSRSVNKHYGGSYLLANLDQLFDVLLRLRKHYPGFLSAKIRVGYHDDSHFLEILDLIEKSGFQMITVHGRTKAQMYKDKANWDYIARAVESCSIPIIGNGDVWTLQDINDLFKHTKCHGVMVARGALKSPWLATQYHLDEDHWSVEKKANMTFQYFSLYHSLLSRNGVGEETILKIFKNLSRYIFDDFPNGPSMKSRALRSQKLHQFMAQIKLNAAAPA